MNGALGSRIHPAPSRSAGIDARAGSAIHTRTQSHRRSRSSVPHARLFSLDLSRATSPTSCFISALGTDFAFTNPGGIRTDLLAGEVTWGDIFSVQPFGNNLVRMTLTGEQIVRALNQQWLDQRIDC